ncbi:hypothetical protein LOAG_18481 [Loa loa]|uniref:Uncharacterized protein n=1 Tax=Loa loa TaxID=7209 RepID=A0A1S0UF36_LOALO|nr:hypothetical protein LOAG_18481 [Loa loa]EJD74163.1 hypothetical protein LOAG_18481 [Loa loa]
MLDLDKTLDEETAADKCILRGSSISKEVEVVISDLMKISSYNLDAQQKFYDALSEVLTKDVPVAEVSSKYGIAVDAFQPYITEARVLLGQSPYSTSSNIRETSTELDSELPNGSRKYADGKNHFDEIFTNIELPLKDISGDTVFTTFVAVHPTNMAKDFSKHEKRYDTGNLLTKAYLLSSMTALILATFDSRRNKILPDTKLDKKLSRKDYSGKPKNLAVKIDKGVNGKPVTASSYSNEIISSNVENGQDFNILSVKSTNDTYFEQLTKNEAFLWSRLVRQKKTQRLICDDVTYETDNE